MNVKSSVEKYIIKCLAGFEQYLADELTLLGAQNISIVKRGVSCEGDALFMCKANFESRLALRVLKFLGDEKVTNEKELYDFIYDYPWERIISSNDTIAVDAVTYSEIFRHSHYVALKTKDAIVDRMRNMTGRRPSIDTIQPNYKIHIHIQHNHCSLLLDTSGDSLHKRGYRANTTVAPINEVLAAGLIAITQWDGNSAFYDPMCGSGTIAIEAAYKALNLPSQWKRNNFAFMRWKDFDLKHWKEYTQERLQASNLEHNFTIHASDVSEKVIKNSKYNYIAAGVDRFVNVTCADIEDIVVKDSEGILITNPPYEERIITGEINVLYKKIGDVFKNKFAGFKAYLISSNIEATKHIGLKAYMKKDLINGDLPCKFLGYELYQGKKQ